MTKKHAVRLWSPPNLLLNGNLIYFGLSVSLTTHLQLPSFICKVIYPLAHKPSLVSLLLSH